MNEGFQQEIRNAFNQGWSKQQAQAIATAQANTYGGYNVPAPVPAPAPAWPRKFADPIQLMKFNNGFIVVFTCQECGLQQKSEYEGGNGDRKHLIDWIDEWVKSVTDSSPYCNGGLCRVLEAIAK